MCERGIEAKQVGGRVMHEEEMIYDLMRERGQLEAEVERLRGELAAARAASVCPG